MYDRVINYLESEQSGNDNSNFFTTDDEITAYVSLLCSILPKTHLPAPHILSRICEMVSNRYNLTSTKANNLVSKILPDVHHAPSIYSYVYILNRCTSKSAALNILNDFLELTQFTEGVQAGTEDVVMRVIELMHPHKSASEYELVLASDHKLSRIA